MGVKPPSEPPKPTFIKLDNFLAVKQAIALTEAEKEFSRINVKEMTTKERMAVSKEKLELKKRQKAMEKDNPEILKQANETIEAEKLKQSQLSS